MPNSMTQDQNYKSIQVFPIHKNTFIGTATAENIVKKFKLIHSEEGEVDEPNVITFTFDDTTTKIINAVAGEDLGISHDTVSITSTKTIRMS